jgi:hypothetical protein
MTNFANTETSSVVMSGALDPLWDLSQGLNVEEAWLQARNSENPEERATARQRLVVWALNHEGRQDYSLWRELAKHVIHECKDVDAPVLTEIAQDCPLGEESAAAWDKLMLIPEEREKWSKA